MDNNQPKGFMKIPLSGDRGKGLFVLINSSDFDKVNICKWYLSSSGYAISKKHGYMHRLIVDAPLDKQVDHKNHNRLDNRKNNLRICTAKENQQNRLLKRYRWCERLGRWEVRMKKDSKWTKRYFKREEDALLAVKKIKSGVEPKYNKSRRNKFLPEYISQYSTRNGSIRYYFRCRAGGKVYTKGGFTTLGEAIFYRDSFFKSVK